MKMLGDIQPQGRHLLREGPALDQVLALIPICRVRWDISVEKKSWVGNGWLRSGVLGRPPTLDSLKFGQMEPNDCGRLV